MSFSMRSAACARSVVNQRHGYIEERLLIFLLTTIMRQGIFAGFSAFDATTVSRVSKTMSHYLNKPSPTYSTMQ